MNSNISFNSFLEVSHAYISCNAYMSCSSIYSISSFAAKTIAFLTYQPSPSNLLDRLLVVPMVSKALVIKNASLETAGKATKISYPISCIIPDAIADSIGYPMKVPTHFMVFVFVGI